MRDVVTRDRQSDAQTAQHRWNDPSRHRPAYEIDGTSIWFWIVGVPLTMLFIGICAWAIVSNG